MEPNREVFKCSPNTSDDEKEDVGRIQSNNTSPSSESSQYLQSVLDQRLEDILKERTKVADSSNIHLYKMRMAVVSQMEEIQALAERIKGNRAKSEKKEKREK